MSVELNCEYCCKKFNRNLSQYKKVNHHYCSRSCSAKSNNQNPLIRRKPKGNCKNCSKPIRAYLQYCKNCRPQLFVIWKDKSLKEAIYIKHHKSSAFALVRTRARAIAVRLKWKVCSVCGYDKHIEIAHIKPIKDFPLEASIDNEINHPSNLLPLCPNCHWEHDHKLVKSNT